MAKSVISLFALVALAALFTKAYCFKPSHLSSVVSTRGLSHNTKVEPFKLAASKTLDSLVSKASRFTASTPYAAIETAIVVGLLSGIDGGFSGDWSHYGLISKETEFFIQSAITSVGLFHIFCASIAAATAKSRKQPVAPAVLHTMLIGGLGLFRVLLQTDETAVKFPALNIYAIKQYLADLVAGSYDATAVDADIDQLLREHRCVMFSFTTCPFCIKAKKLLIDELGINVEIVELDVDKKTGYPIRAQLGRRTGRTSVPSVWIDGVFIGGCNDGPSVLDNGSQTASGKGGVFAFHEEGLLSQMLKKKASVGKAERKFFFF